MCNSCVAATFSFESNKEALDLTWPDFKMLKLNTVWKRKKKTSYWWKLGCVTTDQEDQDRTRWDKAWRWLVPGWGLYRHPLAWGALSLRMSPLAGWRWGRPADGGGDTAVLPRREREEWACLWSRCSVGELFTCFFVCPQPVSLFLCNCAFVCFLFVVCV